MSNESRRVGYRRRGGISKGAAGPGKGSRANTGVTERDPGAGTNRDRFLGGAAAHSEVIKRAAKRRLSSRRPKKNSMADFRQQEQKSGVFGASKRSRRKVNAGLRLGEDDNRIVYTEAATGKRKFGPAHRTVPADKRNPNYGGRNRARLIPPASVRATRRTRRS